MDRPKLYIQRYWDNEADGYICDEGCFWGDDPLDFILMVQLKQCGCGMPEEAGKYTLAILKSIAGRFDKQNPTDINEPFHSKGEAYFVWHTLDHLGLLEHGSGAPGWLTDKGKEVMGDLQVILK